MYDYKLSKEANKKWLSFIHRDLRGYHPLDYKALGEFIIQTIKDNCEVDIYFIEEELKNNTYIDIEYDEKLINNYKEIFEPMNIMAEIIFNKF